MCGGDLFQLIDLVTQLSCSKNTVYSIILLDAVSSIILCAQQHCFYLQIVSLFVSLVTKEKEEKE